MAKLQLTDERSPCTPGSCPPFPTPCQLEQLDTSAIPPTASVLPLRNVLRPDRALPGLPRDAALANAADSAEGQFRVDAVLDDAGES